MNTQARRLADRARQPGHDRSWVRSEQQFSEAARLLLPERFTVEDKPRDLVDFYAGPPRSLGLLPEAKITDSATGRFVFVEVKKQGKDGNAEERAYKHHTSKFMRLLADHTGLPYHAYVTVFCEELATLRRYTTKVDAHIEEDHYLLWAGYRLSVLATYLDTLRDRFLDPTASCAERCAGRVSVAGPLRAADGAELDGRLF